MNIVAIVQARMGSQRLPGKILANVAGIPLLQRVLDRVCAAPQIKQCVVATTDQPSDDVLVNFLESRSIPAFRGSAENVLDRFYNCAAAYSADIVVRVTADDPLKDAGVISRAIELLTSDAELDYCSNTIQPSFPEGLDIEVVRFSALAKAWREAMLPSEQEHVTPYIWKRPHLFKLLNFLHERDLSAWRWTVDHPEDLEFVRQVFAHFADRPLVSFPEIASWLDGNPGRKRTNSDVVRNEGYLKSLQAEKTP